MTPDELKAEFFKYALENDRGQGQAMVDWSYWVVNVLLPRETSKAGEEMFNDGYSEGYCNGRIDEFARLTEEERTP